MTHRKTGIKSDSKFHANLLLSTTFPMVYNSIWYLGSSSYHYYKQTPCASPKISGQKGWHDNFCPFCTILQSTRMILVFDKPNKMMTRRTWSLEAYLLREIIKYISLKQIGMLCERQQQIILGELVQYHGSQKNSFYWAPILQFTSCVTLDES